MISKTEARALIDDVFEQEALVIGGLVATCHIEDKLVWRLIRNLDTIRTKTLRILDDAEGVDTDPSSGKPNLEPHPAIEEFLLKIRRS